MTDPTRLTKPLSKIQSLPTIPQHLRRYNHFNSLLHDLELATKPDSKKLQKQSNVTVTSETSLKRSRQEF